MRVEVLCFAMIRDVVGEPQVQLELPSGATAAEAGTTLALRHPGLQPLLPSVRYAVNEVFVGPATRLHDGDRVAFIPPVSGG
jgi:molybdopterin converting factor subunit 1